MKVLVTGGAGYIGSHTVDMLIEGGHEVVVIDNLSTGHRRAVHPDTVFIQGDLLDVPILRRIFGQHKFDGIFHFASHTLVGESTQRPWLYLRDNVVAASNLLEAAEEFGVYRFILSSTANLFDDPEKMPIAETERIVPGSPYGESKAMIERQLYWMDQLYGLRYCALRYFNAAGAHPKGHIGEYHQPEAHLIPIVLQVALGQREYVTIFGDDYPTPDGTCVRDYVHVMDLAAAHITAFDALGGENSYRFNLGIGVGYSVQQVVETARKVTGHAIPVKFGIRREGDPAESIADSSRFRQEFAWQPQFTSLEAIIQTAWDWHQAHPHGYEA
jgi:UDP-glucose 4-epimerase